LGKRWPALDVFGFDDLDLLLAFLDDFSPTAIEPSISEARVFFATTAARDAASAAIADTLAGWRTSTVDVDDDDWAARSQAALPPVTVGGITVFPSAEFGTVQASIALVVAPSMGFGTGHHATTRLCLAALQTIDLAGRTILDVGTGSGILAIGAARLGASRAIGIDVDADALGAARENVTRNPGIHNVEFVEADVRDARLGPADVVTANLTGALLTQASGVLQNLVQPGGHLIASGFRDNEVEDVAAAFAAMKKVWQQDEDGWIGMMMVKR
jgi:ribosomal protein L11 methyltransferase